LKLFEQLADKFRTVPEYREGRKSYNNLGDSWRSWDREKAARIQWAIRSDKLAADIPDVPIYRDQLARVTTGSVKCFRIRGAPGLSPGRELANSSDNSALSALPAPWPGHTCRARCSRPWGAERAPLCRWSFGKSLPANSQRAGVRRTSAAVQPGTSSVTPGAGSNWSVWQGDRAAGTRIG
jgi:hypothetical protein